MAINFDKRASFLCVLLLAAVSTARPTTFADPSSDKVSLALYYETLCPGCSHFIVNDLKKLVEDDEMMSIVDLRLVPYGNAEILNGTIDCQHGEVECLFNAMEACAMDIVPSLKEHFPFIHCIEKFAEKEEFDNSWIDCFDELKAEPVPILQCSVGDRGQELEFQYAAETESLKPPHEFVPWVTVNGVPLKDDYENFIAYICKAYKGSKVPKTCSSVSLKSTQSHRGKSTGLKGCGRKELPKRTATKIKPAILWRIKN